MIRAATTQDADALLALIAALARDQGTPHDQLTHEHVLRDLVGDPATLVMVAQAPDGSLAGYATGHPTYETAHAERGIYVGDLYVAPEWRRHGLARALLAAMARAGHGLGARHLWLTARADNAAAHALYRRLGGRGEAVMAFACVHQDFLNLAAETAR